MASVALVAARRKSNTGPRRRRNGRTSFRHLVSALRGGEERSAGGDHPGADVVE
jgi:hypothetical protein